MVTNSTKFRPVYSTEAKITNADIHEGWIYVASDTGKIFLDADGRRRQIGGSAGGSGGGSSSLVWANGDEDAGTLVKVSGDASDGDPAFLFSLSAIESETAPDVDALILNADGRFFRVTDNSLDSNRMFAVDLIAVSGGGSGGGGGGTSTIDLFLNWENIDLLGSTYIYGQDSKIVFIPKSTADEDVSITITATDLTGNNPDVIRSDRILSETPYEFNANLLPVSDNIQITVLINSNSAQYNRGKGLTKTFAPIRVLDMYLEKPEGFTLGIQEGITQLAYMPYFAGLGTAQTPIHINYQIDGEIPVDGGALVTGNSEHRQYINIPQQEHGMHTVKLWLTATINAKDYSSEPVQYEVPWVDINNETPIIWTNNELGTVTQYEPAVVQYMVYSSVAAREGSPIEVSLYKRGVLLSTEEVNYSSSSWLSLDLTTNYDVGANSFVITCGSTSKTINFNVSTEGARDLALKHPEQLELNFDSLGRSSKEIKASRQSWVSSTTPKFANEPYSAQLQNFNWYSNGWQNDGDGVGSYLAISNGASVRIPMSTIALNTTARAWTFEVRFRIRNAKKFATLVTNIPVYRYTLNGIESDLGQEKTLEEIQQIGGEVMLDEDGNMVMNEANTVKKIVQTDRYVAMKYLNSNNEGFVIGTQEAYFNTSGQTVNVKYKEGEIINISFVVDRSSDALSIYLNGILSGVASLSAVPAITMENIPFLISSEYCDFDLYKFRVYPIALTMPDIIHNYIADIKNIDLYDENQLTDINDDTVLSYTALLKYNKDHPDDPTMPYAVIDMTKTPQGTDLPHFKGANRAVRIEFTNPVADYLLETGQITPYEYYTHCPSYVADNVDLNVQGTSSQKYPRRNFKTKFKSAKDTWVYTKGELEGLPLTASHTLESGKKIGKKWHMDSEKLGTNKFTWKIDYMESSGSYNTGFANLMGSGVYNKHPLEDLNLADVDASIYRTSVYGFPLLVFHKTAENQYTYIGRYNMNLDKGSNEYYGFEEEVEQPYVNKEWDEMENDKVTVKEHHMHPYIADVAECWELRDNQGTWCSFRYPTPEMREAGFHSLMVDSTEQDPKIEVVQHFEARYHKNADQFEYAQNILLGKENADDYSADIGGSTAAVASAYCYNKLANLERLFNWLDSTDTKAATNAPLDPAVELEVSGKLTAAADIEAAGVTYNQKNVNGTEKTFGTFTKDSVEYRRQKFYAEFDKHLDKHYCSVYFVMTELLLCYDSRGKNMMIATFGPREPGGEYIWYPIFYDIDTQLGLNNVGAKLWDYDEDCSENGTFSTKDSVLWTNFYDVFRSQVISTYRTLRNGKIDYQIIEDSYMCKAGKTFNSYAMMGKRPIIAIGLDEYYKYVLPTKQAWKNQEGKMVTANYLYACQGDRILSRELLINNRLLYMDSKWLGGNFTISTGGMSGLMFRSTGNKFTTTSDTFLDNEVRAEGQVYGKYPVPYFDATPDYYVTPYLNFYVTTFVDENVFQTPEAYNEEKYPNGIPTVVSPSVLVGYQSGAPDQQLNYFAGSEYISSLGDLSLKYINQADIINTPRLLDITIGSDVPGYFNNETLDPFNLHTELDVNGKVKEGDEKSLLNKIILTNVKGLNKYLDVRSPDKLTEFRALGTSLTYALFADGAPLNTVHLPATVTRLVFNQNKNLTRILTETPVVCELVEGVAQYKDHSTYEGLFVDGITNYTPSMQGTNTPINELSFEGDALGYDSYKILYNTVMKKFGTDRSNRLRIRMVDISWTPYVQVEYGEVKLANTQYYYLTDHSTYEPYEAADSAWYDDTLNGRVYIYDNTKDESIITDLSLLDLFYNDKTNTPNGSINQFTNNIETMLNQQSYPTISGEMYVSNYDGDPIEESQLTDKYAACWPNLKIRVANVEKAYISKFVQKLDSGKESEIDITRYAKGDNVHPRMTAKVPVKQNYDFVGWTLNPNYVIVDESNVPALISNGSILTQASDFNNITFSAQDDVYVFYAVFSIRSFTIHFRDPQDPSVEYTSYRAPYGSYLYEPVGYFVTNESNLSDTDRYKFIGWSREINANNSNLYQDANKAKPIKLSDIMSQNEDQTFYALYVLEDCLENPTDDKYFVFTSYNGTVFEDLVDHQYDITTGGYFVRAADNIVLKGKITIPGTHKDANGVERPVVGISTQGFLGITSRTTTDEEKAQGMGDSINIDGPGYGLTHVYWYGDTSKFRVVMEGAFQFAGNYTDFVYFQLPANTRRIENNAFAYCYNLAPFEFSDTVIQSIGIAAFYCCFNTPDSSYPLLHIPGSCTQIGQSAFEMIFYNKTGGFNGITTLQFGGAGDPSQLNYLGPQSFNMLEKCKIQTVSAYVSSGADTTIFEVNLPNESNLRGNTSVGTAINIVDA